MGTNQTEAMDIYGNRTYLNVPIGVRYISDWKELDLPKGHYILNKIVTGCGFTEYCLNNCQKLILVSPRKFLLENILKFCNPVRIANTHSDRAGLSE